jgi:dipeptidyl-peptidase III
MVSMTPSSILPLTLFIQGHFAMFRCLLSAGGGFMTVDCDHSANKLIVRVDRSKILSHGKPAIGELLLKLHIYRCTADVETCRTFYEDLTRLDDVFLEWRRIVLANKRPKQLFVQANTFIENGQVYVREYEQTIEGLIQSWAERVV